ncbi:MAG: T9SS C-terminal target domain-containing protein [Bacteroidetes bacterium]|nr:MAG: T9SS C-terminal target domain-containing protein [Bacteroidota bacterium]
MAPGWPLFENGCPTYFTSSHWDLPEPDFSKKNCFSMKNTLHTLFIAAGMSGLLGACHHPAPSNMPAPTTILSDHEEDGNNGEKRAQWFEKMHRAAPGTNWRALEYETQKNRAERRAQAHTRNPISETLANGHLTGTWVERGSINQAGSVFDAEYDPVTDEIWLLSAGGTLWKAHRDGSDWAPVNQDFRFSHGLLRFVPLDGGGRRLLAAIERVPHYSDDDGQTWHAAQGVPIEDNWANIRHAVVVPDSLHTIYFISKKSYWEPIKIFKSTDKGKTYFPIHSFDTNEFNHAALCLPHHSTEVFLIEKSDPVRFYKINPDTDELDLLSENPDFSFGNTRANLVGTSGDATTIFYAYNNDNEVFRTTDFGQNWEMRGAIDAQPWSVGLFVSPFDPDLVLAGEVDCHRSLDGGKNWFRVNHWWEYYDNIAHKLHADMMDFNAFETADGQPFILISNHGGLNISYDQLNTIDNIGLSGLNVSQYYSVRTNQSLPYWIYAGSQDQGLQRANIYGQDVAEFEQVISGDYGHIVLTDNGDDLWTTYPGGSISYYNFAQSGGPSANWNLDSPDESVWLPPLMAAPDGENAVFMAGGNITGQSGSFLIKLQLDGQNQIVATQGDFDFKSNAGNDGTLSAIEYSTLNPDKFYAATTNGRFFYSNDRGQTWEQTINGIPGGHYLYGQAIYASKKDTNLVFLGGSGYSNPPVYMSKNGGKFFQIMSTGLPPTLVFDLDGDEDENFLFAATEAGPWGYVFEDKKWYDLSGEGAPAQTYWSVEYVREFNVVRFGTYGRGIWDFEIEEIVGNRPEPTAQPEWAVYPNPATHVIQLTLPPGANIGPQCRMTNANGQSVRVFDLNPNAPNTLNVSDLPRGIYFLSMEINGRLSTKKVLLL